MFCKREKNKVLSINIQQNDQPTQEYQKLFYRANPSQKADACMKVYNETKPLYLETDASGVGLGASLLQIRNDTSGPRDTVLDNNILWPIAFASKCLSSAEKRYSNIEREELAYYMAWKNSITTALQER